MNHTLVIQFPLKNASASDFDRMLMIENELQLALRESHHVSGHKIGATSLSIFIHTDDPEDAFQLARDILSREDQKNITAAISNKDDNSYSVIWPENHGGEFVI